jgi:sugar lactone lactonase YvrE
MRRVAIGAGVGLVVLVAALVATIASSPVSPATWDPPADPGPRTGHTLPPVTVSAAVPDTTGPEDVEIDASGRVYAGLDDGWLWRWDTPDAPPVRWVETGGRPLGLTWDLDGDLLVADAFRGLLSVAPSGEVTVLATACGARDLVFTDDLEVAADGRIWFTDASQRFDQHHWKTDLVENVPSGRLCVYDPATAVASEVVDGLAFANGVALDPLGRFVLVAETARYRIRRHWLSGPEAGTTDIFADGLPGFPDGMSQGAPGRFWVAIATPRNPLLDRLAAWPLLRRLVVQLPDALQPQPQRYAHVLAFDERGTVVHDLVDPQGAAFTTVTTVEERGGRLLLGSLVGTVWASVEAPPAPP